MLKLELPQKEESLELVVPREYFRIAPVAGEGSVVVCSAHDVDGAGSRSCSFKVTLWVNAVHIRLVTYTMS